jgi:septum formation protein
VPAVKELTSGDPTLLVVENALLKARAGARLTPEARTILGVDTDVVLDGEMLGKPADADGAGERLRALSGRTHEVLGGVALIHGDEELTDLVRTEVTIRDLTETEVDSYVASGEWEDRAGGYAVQGLGSSLIERIDGDLSNVIGLPIPALSRMIAGLQNS